MKFIPLPGCVICDLYHRFIKMSEEIVMRYFAIVAAMFCVSACETLPAESVPASDIRFITSDENRAAGFPFCQRLKRTAGCFCQAHLAPSRALAWLKGALNLRRARLWKIYKQPSNLRGSVGTAWSNAQSFSPTSPNGLPSTRSTKLILMATSPPEAPLARVASHWGPGSR